MSSSDILILPSFSSDVVDSLPVYYKALVQHLADTGRAVIEDSSEKPGRD